MPDNYVDITVRAADTSAVADLDALKAKLNDLGRKVETAKVNLAGDKEAQAQLTRMEAKLLSWGRRTETAKLKVDGVARAEADIAGLSLALDKLGSQGGPAEQAVKSTGQLPGVLAAAVGAGAALAPVLVTLGFGLGGLGVAAAGVVLPIEKAAKASGGLRANLGKLDPEQRAVARSLLNLGQQYHGFENALKPQILTDFGGALKLAGHLMGDVQPVAKATGTAIGGLLGRIDAEFRSGTWQSFFGFMAKEAGPDVQQVGTALVNLTDALPGLLRGLQPASTELLKIVDASTKLVAVTGRVTGAVTQSASSNSKWEKGLSAAAKLLAGPFLPTLAGTQYGIDKLAGSTKSAATEGHHFTGMLDALSGALQPVGHDAYVMGNQAQAASSKVTKLNNAWDSFLGMSSNLETAESGVIAGLRQMDKDAGKAGASFTGVGKNSLTLRDDFESNLQPSIQNVIDGMRQAGAKSHDLAAVISTDLKPAVDKGALANRGMRNQIFAMAVEAGYTGPNRIAPLTGFIDRNATSLRKAQGLADSYAGALAKIPKNVNTQLTLTYRQVGFPQGVGPGSTGVGVAPPPPAKQGSAMVPAGGGLASSVMSGAVAAASSAVLDRPFMEPKPYYGPRRITNQFIPLGWHPHHTTISNGAELIGVLAALLSQYARTHHGGSAQQAFGYGPG